MGAQKDFEDALYLYHLLDSTLNISRLEQYADDLGVEDEYEPLQSS